MLVLTEDEIHYNNVHNLGIKIKVIKRQRIKKDPRLFFKFYRLCNEFKPDIIHTWGSMLAFYALPAVIIKRIPHINSHITDAPLRRKKVGFQYFITNLGFKYSKNILANSHAGLQSYGVSGAKCKVIYNGLQLDRFSNLPDIELIKAKYNIRTTYAVIMVASFTSNKNYDLLLDVAEILSENRNDITFIGVGDTKLDPPEYNRLLNRSEKLNNVILNEKISNIEALINACDIGVLFTFSEGLSNSIMEYMACGKPVIANEAGGTKELITHDKTGFLLTDETPEEIAIILSNLLGDEDKRKQVGENAKLQIENYFTIERMGNDFNRLYLELAK